MVVATIRESRLGHATGKSLFPENECKKEKEMSAASTAAHMVQVANAIKAMGTVVRVEPEEFIKILRLQDEPLLVRSEGGMFSKSFRYLTTYRGLAFHCKSSTELTFPVRVQLIQAEKMSIPDL